MSSYVFAQTINMNTLIFRVYRNKKQFVFNERDWGLKDAFRVPAISSGDIE